MVARLVEIGAEVMKRDLEAVAPIALVRDKFVRKGKHDGANPRAIVREAKRKKCNDGEK